MEWGFPTSAIFAHAPQDGLCRTGEWVHGEVGLVQRALKKLKGRGGLWLHAILMLSIWSYMPSFAKDSLAEEDQLIFEEADHPQALKDKLLHRLRSQTQGAQDGVSSIRDLSRLTHVCYWLDDLDTLKDLIPRIQHDKLQALQLKRYGEAAILSIGLSLWEFSQNNSKRSVELAHEALSLAKQSQNPNAILRVLAFQSDLYYRLDFDQESIQAVLAARTELKEYPNLSPILRLIGDINVVQQNFEADRTDDNLQLLERYYHTIKDMKLRFHSGILAFFLGDAYDNLSQPNLEKAESYFKESLQTAKSIDDFYTASAAAYKLASLANKRKDSEAAMEYGYRTLELTRNTGSLWRFKAYRELALAHLQRNELDKAVMAIQQSLHDIRPEQTTERIKSLNVAVQVYKKKQDVAQALASAEAIIQLMEQQKQVSSSQDFSKSKVLLGLEASQLQNQILDKDRQLALKDSQLKTVELEKMKKDNVIKTAVVIFLLIVVPVLISLLAYVYRQQKKIHDLNVHLQTDVLGRFLPPSLVQDVVDKKIVWNAHAHHMDVTVVFADLVEFIRICENKDPKRISEIMNRFFSAMSRVIYSEQGTLDKFIGDAVMIIFGAPVSMEREEQIHRSVACARKMMLALDELNQQLEAEDGTSFRMRIGIHAGSVIAGMFGSTERSDYTAVGTTVNIASRIEGLARPNQVLASQTVIQGLDDNEWTTAGLFKLKGISEPQELFEIHLAQSDAGISKVS